MTNTTNDLITLSNYSDWCQEDSIGEEQQSHLMAFLVEGVFVPVMGTTGIVGNLCIVLILSKPVFKETFHKLLICLSIVDSSFILCAMFTFMVRSLGLLEGPLGNFLHPLFLLSLPMGSCALVTSMYLTISISLVYNLPKFLEMTPEGRLNAELSNSPLYNKIYRQYVELSVTVLIPLLALLCLNCRIYVAVTNKELRQNSTQQQKRESKLAVILIAIVMVFFCCHSLKFFLAFSKVHVTIKNNYCITLGLNPYYPKWMHTVTYLNHFMLVLNSSVNFIIYCLVGGKFRSMLFQSLPLCCRPPPPVLFRAETTLRSDLSS